MRISSKLRALVMVPLLAVGGFATLALTVSFGNANEASRVSALVGAAAAAEDLAHGVQVERATAVALLAGDHAPARMTAYLRQTATTDDVLAAYRTARAALTTDLVTIAQQDLLAAIDQDLAGLASLRAQVETGSATSLSAVTLQYRIVIADLLAFLSGVAQGGSSSDISDQIRANAYLAQAAEYVGQEQVAVVRAVAFGSLSPAAQEQITAARVGYTESLTSFASLASAEWRRWLSLALAGPDILTAQRLEDLAGRTPAGSRLDIDIPVWIAATAARMQRMHDVVDRITQVVTAELTATRRTELAWAVAETAGVVVAGVTVVLLALWLATPMLRGLRRLAEVSQLVAGDLLPGAVEGLRAEGALGAHTPAAFAERAELPPLPAGKDEIAEVAGAFTAVYRSAVRLAAEQAVERRSLGTILVNLARRGDRILGRLTSQLDMVERDEQDPRRLEQLFGLDNQIAVLRRTNRTLLTLGGKGPGRVRDRDVSMIEVLRGAQGQVERYRQINLSHVDSGAALAGDVVDDVVHLLAELLDNATAYSSPTNAITVTARTFGDRTLVQITDQGIGMDKAQLDRLNGRLARPDALDVDAVRAMGLTVVGRIAGIYGIRVELRSRSGIGTTAEVTIPRSIMRADQKQLPAPPQQASSRPPETVSAIPRPPAWPGSGHAGPDTPSAYADVVAATSPPRIPQQRPPAVPAGSRAQPEAYLPPTGTTPDTSGPPIFQELWRTGWFGGDSRAAWTTPADAGWHAAAAAAQPTDRVNATGLPQRQPMAQLVPGGVPGPVERAERDNRATAASMAAFARGVGARGPGQTSSDSPRHHREAS